MIKSKIVLLIPRFGVVDRGAEVSGYELARRLNKDFEVTIISRKRTSRDPKSSWQNEFLLDVENIRVTSITEHNKLANFIYNIHPIIAKIMDNLYINPLGIENLSFSIVSLFYLLLKKYDLIFPNNGIWGALVARVVRVIYQTPFLMRTTGGIEPIVAKQSPNLLICESPTAYKWYESHYKTLPLHLIPLGVDLSEFSLKAKAPKFKLQRPIILTVGALIPSKRLNLVVDAVSKLKKGSLIILGKGPEYEKLTSMGTKRLGKNRFLIRNVTHDDIAGYYKLADVFTLPSYQEPFGLVYLEAMAMNKPIVAPNDELRKYIIGRAGVLCDVTNISIYSNAIERVLKTNFGTIPREQARRFSLEVSYKKYKACILNLINEYS